MKSNIFASKRASNALKFMAQSLVGVSLRLYVKSYLFMRESVVVGSRRPPTQESFATNGMGLRAKQSPKP